MDRRRHERFESNLVIRVAGGHGRLRDLSASGVYFTTDQLLAVGDAFSFTLEFHAPPTGPLEATCEAFVLRAEARGDVTGIAAALTDIRFRRA